MSERGGAVIASDEFQNLIQSASGDPDSAVVIRLYRAFLGRVPNDAEVAYWTDELDSGRQTAEDAINLFADSAEFGARLAQLLEP